MNYKFDSQNNTNAKIYQFLVNQQKERINFAAQNFIKEEKFVFQKKTYR